MASGTPSVAKSTWPPPTVYAQLTAGVDDPRDATRGTIATYRHVQYILSTSARGRRSWITEHGIFVTELRRHGFTQGKTYWACGHCDRRNLNRLYTASATGSAIHHLKKEHNVHKPIPVDERHDPTPSETQTPAPLRSLASPPTSVHDKLEGLAFEFESTATDGFDVFENPSFQELLRIMNPAMTAQIDLGREAMRSNFDQVFAEKKKIIQADFETAVSRVHIAFGVWRTSGVPATILEVSAHYIDAQGSLQQRLIAFHHVDGFPSGPNLALFLEEIITKWDLTDRLGCLVSNTASSNDVCTENLFSKVQPDISDIDISDRRIRCFCHILNIVGRAFLYGEDFEIFEHESYVKRFQAPDESELRRCRQIGPVGKLHNIIKWIRSSYKNKKAFTSIVKESKRKNEIALCEESAAEDRLYTSSETRWIIAYLMIQRAITKKEEIQIFLAGDADQTESDDWIAIEDHLTPEDWSLLVEISTILKRIHEVAMRTQRWASDGTPGSLWMTLAGSKYLLETMEGWHTFFDSAQEPDLAVTSPVSQRSSPESPPPSHALPTHRHAGDLGRDYGACFEAFDEVSRHVFRSSFLGAWDKLNDFYLKLEESPLYSGAVILNPQWGVHWLERIWKNGNQHQWLGDAKSELASYWEFWYRDVPNDSESATPRELPLGAPGCPSVKAPEETLEEWAKSRLRAGEADRKAAEFDRFLQLHLFLYGNPTVDNPITWWTNHRESFPTLSKLALDVLAIPAISTVCEHFRRPEIVSRLLSMEAEAVEKIACLRNWLKGGAITLGGIPYVRPEDLGSSDEEMPDGENMDL